MTFFAEAKEPFLRGLPGAGQRPHGRDTFTLVFRNLGPEQFGNAFQRFMV